jgi:hypothetical protein
MTTLPNNMEIANSRLPASYEQAKVALASCAKIDECKEWANKAEALASYAKMADDDSLRTLADRIQARAVRRMGELLKQFDAQGRRSDQQLPDGTVQKLSQGEVAAQAGISERQAKTAVRVANVPEDKFDAAVEAEKPATVTALAEMGKKVHGVPVDSFKKATHLIGGVKRFAEFCRGNAPATVAAGLLPYEIDALRDDVAVVDAWLGQLVTVLPDDSSAPVVPTVVSITPKPEEIGATPPMQPTTSSDGAELEGDAAAESGSEEWKADRLRRSQAIFEEKFGRDAGRVHVAQPTISGTTPKPDDGFPDLPPFLDRRAAL